MKQRLLSSCLTLLPVTAGAVDNVSYIYYAWDGSTLSEPQTDYKNATEVTDSNTWGAADTTTWYVFNSNVTINQRVTVTGDVHLILADGFTLAVNGGIHLTDGNRLTIYAQSGGTGQLEITGVASFNAGIGGNFPFSHASDYAIVIDDKDHSRPPDI